MVAGHIDDPTSTPRKQVVDRTRAARLWYSQTDVVEGEASTCKGTFVDVDIRACAMSNFAVMPTARGSARKRKCESEKTQEKTQDGRGLH